MGVDHGAPRVAHAARIGEGVTREAAEDVQEQVVGEAHAVVGVHRPAVLEPICWFPKADETELTWEKLVA